MCQPLPGQARDRSGLPAERCPRWLDRWAELAGGINRAASETATAEDPMSNLVDHSALPTHWKRKGIGPVSQPEPPFQIEKSSGKTPWNGVRSLSRRVDPRFRLF